jgi:hypothetical protein
MIKRALCVGINKYLLPGNDLRGCRGDAFNMAAFFEIELGVPRENIVILLDRQATKTNIMLELERMGMLSAPDDFLGYSHSSHGTKQFDINGDELDLNDEALCCYDVAPMGQGWDPKTVILDDELRQFCAGLAPGVRFEAWIDTCHSGTGLRDMGLSYDRARLLIPRGGMASMVAKRMGIIENPEVVLWAACAADQLSADSFIDGEWCGAFTNAFLTSYKEVSRSLLLARVRTKLRQGGYDQVPQLEVLNPALKDMRVGQ